MIILNKVVNPINNEWRSNEEIEPVESVKRMEIYDPPSNNRLGKLRLDFNENTMGCSPSVIEALNNFNPEIISIYPEYENLMKELAEYFNIRELEVLPTNGTDEAIHTIILTYLSEGDEVILPVPTFSMFKINTSIVGGDVKEVLYNEDLSFPTNKVLDAISDKTKMIILVNPNNPTGTRIKQEDIKRIIKKAPEALILIDEAYSEFMGETSKNLINDFNNVIITRTFSKAFGLAGLRLGCAISNKKIIRDLRKVISPYSVNSLAVIAGIAALRDEEFVDDYVNEVRKNKQYVTEELEKLGVRTFESKSNFILCDFGEECDKVQEELKKKEILVRNRSKYPLLNGCIRIGVGVAEESAKLIKELKNILRDETILFDLDGVLVDVSNSYRQAIKKTVEYFTNKEPASADIQALKEKGGYNNDWDLTEALIVKEGFEVEKQEIIDKFQEFYLGRDGKKGFIDSEEWLLSKEILKELYKKYRLGIVTGRPGEEAEYVLERFNVRKYFDSLVTMDDCPKGKSKPNPYGINLALEEISGENPVYFGDSVDDMKAAVNAGITGIGVTPPSVQSDKLRSLLKENGGSEVIKSVNEVREVLG